MVGHTALGSWQSHPIPFPSYMVERGLLFQVVFHPMAWSPLNLVGVKPGDFGVVIGCQVDDFTCTWLAECFNA